MTAPPWPGRDRSAVLHPARPGASSDGRRHRVIVVGGGIAGLAAATALAERDVAVTVVEAEDQLGGRVRSWSLPDGRTMSRGFHAFFRQYYNLRALLRRSDPDLARLCAIADYPLVSPAHRDSFARIPRRPPLNLLGFVLRSKTFTLRDLARVDVPAACELLDVRFPETFVEHDGESAAQFLDRLRFPEAARHLALEVFARSFFADPADFSAGELVGMFHAYFLGSAEGLLFDVPDDDYDTALWRPLADYLQARGVELHTGTEVESVRSEADGVTVTTAAGSWRADAVVVAAGLATTQRVLPSIDPGWDERLANLRLTPRFAVHRLWLDRPVHADRPAFLGTAGFDLTDNISVLERYEAGAADWAGRNPGTVVELHAYALPAELGDDEVQRRLRRTLDGLYPELAGARTLHEEYLVAADCPLVGTEPWQQRPEVTTPDPRILLAGDMVRCDYPVALMERAATTGFQAANLLLERWQVAGHDLWTVPLGARNRVARLAGRATGRQRTSPVRTR